MHWLIRLRSLLANEFIVDISARRILLALRQRRHQVGRRAGLRARVPAGASQLRVLIAALGVPELLKTSSQPKLRQATAGRAVLALSEPTLVPASLRSKHCVKSMLMILPSLQGPQPRSTVMDLPSFLELLGLLLPQALHQASQVVFIMHAKVVEVKVLRVVKLALILLAIDVLKFLTDFTEIYHVCLFIT